MVTETSSRIADFQIQDREKGQRIQHENVLYCRMTAGLFTMSATAQTSAGASASATLR